VRSQSERDEHIAGLGINKMTPSDMDVFFKRLSQRVPARTSDELAHVLGSVRDRIKQLAVDLGSVDAREVNPSNVERTCELVVDQFAQMRRRDWKARIDDTTTIDFVRQQVGEISVDLHDLSGR
jgi:hypothetical protein